MALNGWKSGKKNNQDTRLLLTDWKLKIWSYGIKTKSHKSFIEEVWLSKDKRNKQPKKLKGIVTEEDSDPKTIKEALIKVLEEQGITVIRNK